MNILTKARYGAALLAASFLLPAAWSYQTSYTAFKPGTVWLANDSVHIDCHGGNIMYSPARNKFYWYGEHYGTPQGVACYSSKDLYNWVNEGVVLQKGAIQVCERPKVVYNDSTKKYVMWFHYDNSSYTLAQMAVAVSDSPTGPFTMQSHMRPHGHQSRDLGMFSDSGKVYLLYSADSTNLTIRIVQLTSDYTGLSDLDTNINAHCEGPGMCSHNGTLCLITSPCNGWSPGKATWYSAPGIRGKFVSKGDPCIGDSAHTTFNSQSCFIFKVPGYADGLIYMGDRWNGSGNKNSQYVFLPVAFSSTGAMQLRYYSSWDLSVFTPDAVRRDTPRQASPSRRSVGRSGTFGDYNLCGKRLPSAVLDTRHGAGSRAKAGLYIVVPENGVPSRILVNP